MKRSILTAISTLFLVLGLSGYSSAQSSLHNGLQGLISADGVPDPDEFQNPVTADEYLLDRWQLFPNPAADQVQLDFGRDGSRKKVQVFDLTGKIVLEQEIFQTKIQLDISDLVPGIYLVRVKDQTKRLEKI